MGRLHFFYQTLLMNKIVNVLFLALLIAACSKTQPPYVVSTATATPPPPPKASGTVQIQIDNDTNTITLRIDYATITGTISKGTFLFSASGDSIKFGLILNSSIWNFLLTYPLFGNTTLLPDGRNICNGSVTFQSNVPGLFYTGTGRPLSGQFHLTFGLFGGGDDFFSNFDSGSFEGTIVDRQGYKHNIYGDFGIANISHP
jgi:hypothetical protein